MSSTTTSNEGRTRKALHLHQNGDTSEAERLYDQVLQENPANVDALHLYGMLLHETGRGSEGLQKLELAVSQRPGVATLHNARAVVLLGLNRLDDAEQAARTAINLQPDLPEAWSNLSCVLQRQGRLTDAINAIGKLLEIDPRRNDALKDLARIAERENCTDATVAACVNILKRLPRSVAAHLTLGLLFANRVLPEQLNNVELIERSRLLERAIYHLETAISIQPCCETYDALGTALLNANRHDEALQNFEWAIECDARFAKSYEGRGRALLELGRVDDAITDFSNAISISPKRTLAQFELAKIDRKGNHHEAISQISGIIDASARAQSVGQQIPPSSYSLSQRDQSLLHYAIANRYERIGERDAAMTHFKLANEVKEHLTATEQENALQSWMDKRTGLQATFTRKLIESKKSDCVSDEPILIVSMPRSGTTLTEQILAKHPSVLAGGELFDISDIAHTLSRRLGTKSPYPECIQEAPTSQLTDIADEYLKQLRATVGIAYDPSMQNDGRRITDKMPTNFWHLGLIACLFPNARIVHVQRHPLDVCLSCFKQNLIWPYSSLEVIGSYFDHYVQMMDHWKRTLLIEIHSIRYEDLVQSTESQVRQLVDYCGLQWHEACLEPTKANNSVQTPSKWQVRQPIYQTSVESWRQYEKQLQPLAKQLVKLGILDSDFSYRDSR